MSVSLTSLDGERGVFKIGQDGLHPNVGLAFVYEDKRQKFWFYINSDLISSESDYYEVNFATSTRFGYRLEKLSIADQQVIEQNIRLFFKNYNTVGERVSAGEGRRIIFTWKFSR